MATSRLTLASKVKLNSGYELPVLGFGVYQIPPEKTQEAAAKALELGYRHIDSAANYRNEANVGGAITASLLPREDVFFTSKIPKDHMSYELAKAQVMATLASSQMHYIDLMLIHAPYGGSAARKGVWRALVEAVEEGKIRSIGVSNYGVHHLDELEQHIAELEEERGGKGKGGVLSVGQWEIHPWCRREDIVEWCRPRGVVVEAYSPLVQMKRSGDAALRKLAEKHGRSEAQVLIRWSLQHGYVPLPKSVTPERIRQNSEVFGWELSEEDIKALGVDQDTPVDWDPTRIALEE
jgi:diketogulonate reductase-like aldo/keto reductase